MFWMIRIWKYGFHFLLSRQFRLWRFSRQLSQRKKMYCFWKVWIVKGNVIEMQLHREKSDIFNICSIRIKLNSFHTISGHILVYISNKNMLLLWLEGFPVWEKKDGFSFKLRFFKLLILIAFAMNSEHNHLVC